MKGNRKWDISKICVQNIRGGAGALIPVIDEKVELRLELSNICNEACLFCPNRKIHRKRMEMSEELVERLLKEASLLGVNKVGLFMNGEPFITKKLAYYIELAKKLGYSYIYLTTNGALATEEKLKECLNAGLDSIKFSINAGSRESYKVVHGHDDYDKVMEHLKFAFLYRKESGLDYKILSSFVVTRYTVDEIEKHYENIKPFVDELVFFNVESFAGQMINEIDDLRATIDSDRVLQYKIQNKAPCNKLWTALNVTCEGYLTLCCSEAFNYLVIEDLNEMGLEEAWYGERMNAMRKRHLEGKLTGTQCAVCLGEQCDTVKPLNEKLFYSSLK